jgi:hypothetical protein
METWLLDAAIFAAGLGCGILLARVWGRLSFTKRRSQKLSAARQHILTGLKETHEQEILHEAFRATEALRSELFRSLHGLRASMNLMLTPAPQPTDNQQPSTAETPAVTPTAAGGNPNRYGSN